MSNKTFAQKMARAIQRVGEDERGVKPCYTRCLAITSGITGVSAFARELEATRLYLHYAAWLHKDTNVLPPAPQVDYRLPGPIEYQQATARLKSRKAGKTP